MSVDAVLQIFGGFFLTYCLRYGYDKMLKTLGGDIISFLQNLDSLHSLLALTYTGIKAPSFRWVIKALTYTGIKPPSFRWVIAGSHLHGHQGPVSITVKLPCP